MRRHLSLLFLTLLSALSAAAQDDLRAAEAERVLTFLRHDQADSVYVRLAEQLRPSASASLFAGVMAQVEGMAGAYQRHEPWAARTIMGTEGLAALLHFERTDLGLFVVFDEQLRLLGVQFIPAAMVQEPATTAFALPAGAIELTDTICTADDIRLPAVITMPATVGPQTPIVVFVHGSGPLDRDETVMANKPFRDLAYLLASRGIATLRYDKRTFAYPGATIAGMDDETITDALAALRLARTQLGRVYLLGHSLGAMLAPAIAQRTPVPLQGVVLMAAPARDLEQVVRQQLAYLRPADAPPSYEDDALQLLRQRTPHYLQPQHQVETALQLTLPMLFLQGERDYQVPMIDFRLWRQALGGRAAVSFRSYPKLNHLFLEGEGDSTPIEYTIEGHVPGDVADDIARFCR